MSRTPIYGSAQGVGISLSGVFCLFLPFGSIAFEKKLAEMFEIVNSTDLIIKLWVNCQVEVIIDLLNLSEVLILHLSTGRALRAVLGWVWEQDLVDHDVMNVDLLLS